MLEVENLICEYPEGEGKTVVGLALPSFQMKDGEAWGWKALPAAARPPCSIVWPGF